ncbi:MAG TPA: hypothetical protein VF288_12035 [Mycobacteriales bacterium]
MPVPIACTLTPTGQADQLAEWRALLAAAVTGVAVDGGRATFDLADGFDVAALVDLARREQACCGFLGFSLEIAADGVRLVITAPPEAAGVLDGFASLTA